MKKKVPVEDLRSGMYVSELDRNWRDTPFLFQGFEITSDEEIEQLKQHCKHVFIDTDEGSDVSPKPRRVTATSFTAVASGDDSKERVIYLEKVVENFAPWHRHAPRYQDLTTVDEEIGQAKIVVTKTRVFRVFERGQ